MGTFRNKERNCGVSLEGGGMMEDQKKDEEIPLLPHLGESTDVSAGTCGRFQEKKQGWGPLIEPIRKGGETEKHRFKTL